MKCIRLILPVIAAVVLLSCSSASIYDSYGDQRQASFRINVVDSDGVTVPESEAHRAPVYCFINGIYRETLMPYTDGTYRYTFAASDRVTVVALAGADTTQYTLHAPLTGEAISNLWMQLAPAAGTTTMPQNFDAIYYGSWSGMGSEVNNSSVINIPVRDTRGKVHVFIRGLQQAYGDGDYRVVVEGARTGLSFDGTTTKSASTNYEMAGGFMPRSGNWLTPEFTMLPTAGSTITVKVYKQDGTKIIDASADSDGKPFEILPRKNQVFYFSLGDHSQINIMVMDYEDIWNNVFF